MSIRGIQLGVDEYAICDGKDVRIVPSCISFSRLGMMKIGEKAADDLRKERGRALKYGCVDKNVYDDFIGTLGSETVFNNPNLGKSFSSEELLSLFITSLGIPNDESKSESDNDIIVMAFPVSFDSQQLTALNKVVQAGPCKKPILIASPLAAAVACNFKEVQCPADWIVLDFNSAQVDVTLVHVSEGVAEIVDKSSNPDIGGNRMLRRIISEVFVPNLVDHYELGTYLNNSDKYDILVNAMMYYAEKTHKILCDSDSIELLSEEEEFGNDEVGVPIDLDLVIGKKCLETIERPFYAKAIGMVQEILDRNGIKSVEKLILAGRFSGSGLLQEMVGEKISASEVCGNDPQSVISRGAAIWGAIKENEATDTTIIAWKKLMSELKSEIRNLATADKETGNLHNEEIKEIADQFDKLSLNASFKEATRLLERVKALYTEVAYDYKLMSYLLYQKVHFNEADWINILKARFYLDEGMNVIKQKESSRAKLWKLCNEIYRMRADTK